MFKVGDKVRRIKEDNCCGGFCVKYGSVYTVNCVKNGWLELKETQNTIWLCSAFELVKEKNMSKVNLLVSEDSVTASFDGKLVTIKEGDRRFELILEALRDGREDDIPEIIDTSLVFKNTPDVELVDGHIFIKGKKIPEVLTDRVLKFKDKKLPFEPLLKFAKKLMTNPSFNSRQMLYKFLEHNGHPITKEGNFIAYKKVRTDFKDCHTGTMDNSIGTVVEMPREEVDDNPNNTCSSGLHVAAYKYASEFSKGHLVEVEINPEDVVAVPNDYNGEKMRVCRYEVKAICESKLEDVDLYGEIYDNDKYFENDYDGGW